MSEGQETQVEDTKEAQVGEQPDGAARDTDAGVAAAGAASTADDGPAAESGAESGVTSAAESAPGPAEQEDVAEKIASESAPGATESEDVPEKPDVPEESFADMLSATDVPGRDVSVGDKISGVLVKLEGENAFVDFGGRSEGVIRVAELKDAKGELEYKVGDPLEAFVATAQDDITLTRKLASGDAQTDTLYQAYKSGMPVEGRVDAVNKWGLGVTIQGSIRAFCPISQVDSGFVESAEEFRDKTMTFRIIEFRNQGRNIVLSRRALIEAEQTREEDDVRETAKRGAQLEGTVTRLENFGAFVDLGAGVEGLVHISEISHKRIEHPQDVLTVGDHITVAVLRTKNLGSKRKERISLSIRALEKDPWDEVRQNLAAGTVVDGKVDSLEDFGAFVEIAPGVRGLLHVSEIADRRIGHPREELGVGQEVKVVVLELDTRRKRVRLSMKQVESMESAANLRDFQERRQQEEKEEPGSSAMMDALRRAHLID